MTGDLVQTGAGDTEGWMKRGDRTFQAEGTARAKAQMCEAVWPHEGWREADGQESREQRVGLGI